MRRSMLAAAAGAVACLLAACAGGAATTGSPPVTAATVARGVADVEPAVSPAPYGAADTAFGLDVLRTWCQADPDDNLVFSPAVLASALGLAFLGAEGPTATAMADVLHLPARSRGALLAGLAARLTALRAASGGGVTLAASDNVWSDPSLPPLKSYLDDAATGYDAGVGEAPFQADPTRAAAEVNQAISRNTRGQIPKLVTPDLVAGMGWVLTSALSMDAHWLTPFDTAQTAGGAVQHAGRRRADRAVHAELPAGAVGRGRRLDRGLAALPGRQAGDAGDPAARRGG